MRKVLMFVILLITVSCSDSVTIPKSEYNKLKSVKVKVKRTVTFPESSVSEYYKWEIIQGSDGHDYMENQGGSAFVMMHYVECSKCKKK